LVRIRLSRAGACSRPFYRIVAIDGRRKRDGRALEFLGTYDPRTQPPALTLRREALEAWVARGARLSDSVRSLVRRAPAGAGEGAGGG
jgi:small subunit ribosomal protein S16